MFKPLSLFFIIQFIALNAHSQFFLKEKWVTVKTNIYCTRCKDCTTCFNYLKSASYYIIGVKKFKINHQKQTFSILFNPNKTTIPKIRQAISNLGYNADKIPADSLAQSKLNLCCKKL